MLTRNLVIFMCLVTLSTASWLDFQNSMKQMQQNMLNMQNNLMQMGQKIKTDIDHGRNTNISDLSIRHHTKDPKVFYDCSGCKCEKLSCTCCGLVESLSNSSICYTLNYSMNEKNLQIVKNETVISSIKSSELRRVCDDSSEELCLGFYQVETNDERFKGCMDLLASISDIKVKLGCFLLSPFTSSVTRQATIAHSGNKTEYINMDNKSFNITEGLDGSLNLNLKTFDQSHSNVNFFSFGN